MGKIVVIGGGKLAQYETLAFDTRIVEQTGKPHPHALFIPTASGDSEGYVKTFTKVYGKRMGCKTDVLYLLKTRPAKRALRQKILSADLIYVGGGNTLKMMKRWRLLGVDKLLKEAYTRGLVLSGLSAGGICWFEAGHSDSMSFYHPDDWHYIKVSGLGLLRGIHCPHFDGKTQGIAQRTQFLKFMKKYSAVGIAIENHCAMEFVDGKYRVLSARKGRKAYRVFKKRDKIIIEEIPRTNTYSPVFRLYQT